MIILAHSELHLAGRRPVRNQLVRCRTRSVLFGIDIYVNHGGLILMYGIIG